jgi:poly(3-hydroxybutyrate) depolymerase
LAGPIDVRVNPNNFIKRTASLPHSIMKMHIHTVPKGYPGVGRKVYPGYMQLMGFVSLNLRNHVRKHVQFFKDVAADNLSAAEKHREFYDEYNAMMDSTAEFYLQTLERVFFDQHLAKGTMRYRGRLVNPAAIRDIPLLTLEGENDDMVAIGVTEAAQGLCSNLPDKLREHRVEPGVGHYGIFNGTIYRNSIAPRMIDFMQRYRR